MEKKIKVVRADRPYETVGEAVRAEIIKELNELLVWSTNNTLTQKEVERNAAIYEIVEYLENKDAKATHH